MAEPKEKRSAEDLQREILEVELQTKKFQLAAARKQNDEFETHEKQRKIANTRRMAELEEGRKSRDAVQKRCRHKSGGSPNNILRGGGIGSFSLLSRSLLPDGVSILIQCPRCRLKRYPPQPSLRKTDPEQYIEEMKDYNKLLEQSLESGIENSDLRGPTFQFTKDGVPFVPDRL